MEKRRTSKAGDAGSKAGFMAGIIYTIFCELVLVLFKTQLITEFELVIKEYSLPYTVNQLYILTLMYGLLFGKLKVKSIQRVYLLGILFGLGFGLITNLSLPKIVITISCVLFWIVFSVLFSKLYEMSKRNVE